MPLSVQILNFNKENSSESFLNNLTPTDEDKKTYNNLKEKHLDYLEDKNEENEMFGADDMSYDDVKYVCNISIEESEFDKAIEDCGLFNTYDCICLNKTNSESFKFLLNIFEECGGYLSFMDENLEYIDFEEVKELIKQKQQASLPVVFNYIYLIFE